MRTINLIALQEKTLARMLEPRTSEARACRNASRAVRRYIIAAMAAGFTEEQVQQQARDIWDMYRLHLNAEGE